MDKYKENIQNTEQLKKIEEIKKLVWDSLDDIYHRGYRGATDDITEYYEDIVAKIDEITKTTPPHDEIKREAVREFLESQIEYEAEEYDVCPLCERELIWGEIYCPDDRRKLVTKTRNKLEWSNKNVVIKELIETLTQSKEGGE